MVIDGVQINTAGFDFDNPQPDYDELKAYIAYVRERVPTVSTVQVKSCGDGFVDVTYTARGVPFERIRRITGYLVGTTDRWNDAKQAEERDRFKHINSHYLKPTGQ